MVSNATSGSASDKALEKFKSCAAGCWRGRKLTNYKLKNLRDECWMHYTLSREELRCLVRDKDVSVEVAAVAIMSWGGARYPAMRDFWENQYKWSSTLASIRADEGTRA
ncbi:MAG: hypothetical protein WA918_08940, partial [Erythrobacter sp.]